jgi:hypothetical protein
VRRQPPAVVLSNRSVPRSGHPPDIPRNHFPELTKWA